MPSGNGNGARQTSVGVPVGEVRELSRRSGRLVTSVGRRLCEASHGDDASPGDRARISLEEPVEDFVTVVLDGEGEYVRFTDYVFDTYGSSGWRATNVPIVTSLRVRSEVFERTKDRFAVRKVTEADLCQAQERVRDLQAFDPATLKDRHVPGVPAEIQA